MAIILEKVSHTSHGDFWIIFPDTIAISKGEYSTKIGKSRCFLIQVNRLNGETRLFKENDGYEEVIIDKIVNWINTSSPSEEANELELNQTSIISIMKIKLKNGDVAVIEPAYNCVSQNQVKTCTIADGEVIYTSNNKKLRLKSVELYDWLLVGWKYESVGAPKDELLEETLYSKYFSYLDETYADFIMCPKIDKVETIDGNTRRHIVQASALNYSAHHGDVPFDRIHIMLTDTPENGVKINKVTIQKGIIEKESAIQCRRAS